MSKILDRVIGAVPCVIPCCHKKESRKRSSASGETAGSQKRMKNDESVKVVKKLPEDFAELMILRECLKRNKVIRGDRLTFFRSKLNSLRTARRLASNELFTARNNARTNLRNQQQEDRTALMMADAHELVHIYDREIKKNPEEFLKGRGQQWDLAEVRNEAAWQELTAFGALSLEVAHKAAKHVDLWEQQQKGYTTGPALLKLKTQNFTKEFNKARKDVKNACGKMELAVKSATAILDDAKKEHDIIAMQQELKLIERRNSAQDGQTQARKRSCALKISEKEIEEIRMVLGEECADQREIDGEYRYNLEQLNDESEFDHEVREEDVERANKERLNLIKIIKAVKRAN